MKCLVLISVLAVSTLAASTRPTTVPITPVKGESWLNHLHQAFGETSMGKTYHLGPSLGLNAEQTHDLQRLVSADSIKQTVTMRGSDLYRLNCWACHGEFGLGAPPEINSVINPTRATSTQLVMERMKNVGMEMRWVDAAQLASQSKHALLQRLHSGGTNMPPFPHLSEAEVHAIFNYLRQLAGIPGAEKQQAVIKESRLQVGEHIVKSTCHICHNAAGGNPEPQQIFDGAIPPLNTLTTRVSLPDFERKVRIGAPSTMGTPPSQFRGRMPVFYYLRDEEVADAYLYLKVYPPAWEALDPALPAIEHNQAASKMVPIEYSVAPKITARTDAGELSTSVLPLVSETFAALLLSGGLWFTFREIRRLTAIHEQRKALSVAADNIAHGISKPNGIADAEDVRDKQPLHRQEDYYTFESSWFSRLLEKEDKAA
jgi:mono/diheme cytochrome c family protein